MSKVEKKHTKLKERIQFLEEDLLSSLTKKDSNTKEINVSLQRRKIADLEQELIKLK
jgi:hypothetical protein